MNGFKGCASNFADRFMLWACVGFSLLMVGPLAAQTPAPQLRPIFNFEKIQGDPAPDSTPAQPTVSPIEIPRPDSGPARETSPNVQPPPTTSPVKSSPVPRAPTFSPPIFVSDLTTTGAADSLVSQVDTVVKRINSGEEFKLHVILIDENTETEKSNTLIEGLRSSVVNELGGVLVLQMDIGDFAWHPAPNSVMEDVERNLETRLESFSEKLRDGDTVERVLPSALESVETALNRIRDIRSTGWMGIPWVLWWVGIISTLIALPLLVWLFGFLWGHQAFHGSVTLPVHKEAVIRLGAVVSGGLGAECDFGKSGPSSPK